MFTIQTIWLVLEIRGRHAISNALIFTKSYNWFSIFDLRSLLVLPEVWKIEHVILERGVMRNWGIIQTNLKNSVMICQRFSYARQSQVLQMLVKCFLKFQVTVQKLKLLSGNCLTFLKAFLFDIRK